MANAMLTAQDVGTILRVPTPYVYRLARLGVLNPVRLGRYVRFTQETVDSFILSNTGEQS